MHVLNSLATFFARPLRPDSIKRGLVMIGVGCVATVAISFFADQTFATSSLFVVCGYAIGEMLNSKREI